MSVGRQVRNNLLFSSDFLIGPSIYTSVGVVVFLFFFSYFYFVYFFLLAPPPFFLHLTLKVMLNCHASVATALFVKYVIRNG